MIEKRLLPNDTFYSNQTLCYSLNKNPVPLLTITSKGKKAEVNFKIFLAPFRLKNVNGLLIQFFIRNK